MTTHQILALPEGEHPSVVAPLLDPLQVWVSRVVSQLGRFYGGRSGGNVVRILEGRGQPGEENKSDL